jgi:hypothetical protein
MNTQNYFGSIGDVWVEDGMVQAEFNPHYVPEAILAVFFFAFVFGRLTKRCAK